MRPAPTVSRRVANTLITLSALATGGLFIVTLILALWTPGSFDLTTAHNVAGQLVVSWVAPNGPADSAGAMPGDLVVSWDRHGPAPGILTVIAGRRPITVTPVTLVPTDLDLFDTGLGLGLLALGTLVARKSADRAAGGAFWRLCLLAGTALAVVPAGRHGVPWLLPLEPLALALFGPAFLEVALMLPGRRSGVARRTWRPGVSWVPALIYLLCYGVYWVHPALLASIMPLVNGSLLSGYIVAGFIHIGNMARCPRTADQQVQLKWIAIGLVGAFLPFVLFTELPDVLRGRDLVPAQVSILAILLLPVGIGMASARTELLGITALVRRTTLRVLVNAVLLAGLLLAAGLLAGAGPARWGWPELITATSIDAFATVGFLRCQPRLTRWAEATVLHDVYDSAVLLQEIRATLAHAPEEASTGALVRLCTALNLTDAALLWRDEQWSYLHPCTVNPIATQADTVERARRLFDSDDVPCWNTHDAVAVSGPDACNAEEQGQGPLYVLPLHDGADVLAVLCLGPKRSGERYTRQDHTVLDVLSGHMALVLAKWQLERQVAGSQALWPSPPVPVSHAIADDGLAGKPLTCRELEILRHIAAGRSSKEIGRLLGIATKTVEKHIENLYYKLGAHGRIQAVVLATAQGYLP